MKPILTQLFAGLFLLLAAQAFGQALSTNFVLTSPAPAPSYPIGTHLVIELRVTNFTNIESMQFPIAYNKDAMKFDSLTNAAFSNWNAGNYVSNAGAGKVGVSWDGYSNGANMPFSFPNNTALFKLHFTVIGNGLSSVNISAASAPPAIDVVGNGQPVVLNYQNGGTPTLTLGTGNPPPPPLVGFKIVANSIYIPQGERGCMPVTVNDFDNIVSMQWAMHWDNTVLNYECVRGFNLTGWSATDFNSTFLAGTLLGGWSDPAGVGVTRVDGARIVDVCFKAIGNMGANTTVTIDGVGFPPGNGTAEAYNANSVNVWTTGGVNGASGVSAPVNIITTPPSPFDATYTVEKVDAANGTMACVGVKVKNFTAITNSEFALSYNPAELAYTSVDFGTNPLNLIASNVTNVSNPGVVKFLWANTNGATVADDAKLFSACFNVLALAGVTSNISFTTTACPTVTGIGTARSTGGITMAMNNGWVKVPSGPTLTPVPVKCFGGNTGSISLANPQGTTPMTYTWAGPGINGTNQGQQNPTGLIAGTYTVTVTYAGGSTGTGTAIVIQPPTALSQTNMVNTVSCFGGNNGAINLTPAGGTAPYTFNWTHGPTTEDVNNLGVSIYTVTIKDVNDCTLGPVNITVSGFNEIKLSNSSITDVSCTGLSTGSIVITNTGGAGGYTYKWSNNSTTKDLMNMPKGTYSVTVTDLNGCTKVFSNLTINEPTPLSGNLVSKTDVKCAGSATGSATLSVAGGTGNMTYCWSTGVGPCASQVQNPTNLPAGTYTPIITDQNGCTTTVPNVVIAAPTNGPITVTGSGTSATCFGQATGAINMAVSGGWGNYTYAWSGGNAVLPPIPSPTNVPPGTYTLTTTDSGQCSATQTVTVGGPQVDITPATTINQVKCFGTNDGAIQLNLTGGNGGPYSATWTNTSLMGESIGALAPNTYQPTVADNKGCTKVLPPVVVTGPDVLLVDTMVTAANPSNGAIDLVIMSGGTGNPTNWQYSWTGPNGYIASTQDISNLAVGVYTVVITDSNNCQRTFSFEVPSGNVLGGTTYTTSPACNQNGCIHLNFPATSSAATPFTLNWGTGSSQTSSLTESICSLPSGSYNLTVTAANGNSMVFGGIQVGQNDPASVNSNTQQPFSSLTKNGKITLTPAQGVQCQLNYLWSNGQTTSEVKNLGQGTFTVTVTNPCSGCTYTQEFPLEYSPLASVNTTQNPSCANTATGSINLTVQGGNMPYVFLWSNGETTEDIINLLPGVYIVTATDSDNRVYNETFTLTSQSTLEITNVNETSQYGPFQVSGSNMCDGAATLAFIPGIGNTNILWSNGVTTPDNSTLCGGAYTVTITDAASGCTSVWSDNLSAPPAIAATDVAVGVTCFGDCTGSAKVYPVGGVGPYFIEWPSGQKEAIAINGFSRAVNLCGGNFNVTITDANDVAYSYNVSVPAPAEIVGTFSPTTPRNFNACDGELLIETTGAVAPITYVWSGSFGHTGNGERAGNLCSGEFVEFYITDANGCTAYVTDSVPYPEDGCFRVSPIITPGQQDGKNDNVIITCINTAYSNTMEIYNRWGQLVFKAEDYNNNDADRDHNWNGLTKGGEVLAEGVYYYVLTFKYVDDQGVQREGTRKGAINLLR